MLSDRLQIAKVHLIGEAVISDLIGRFRRNNAQSTLGDRKCLFDIEVALNASLVGLHLPHHVGAEHVTVDSGVDSGCVRFQSSSSCDGLL